MMLDCPLNESDSCRDLVFESNLESFWNSYSLARSQNHTSCWSHSLTVCYPIRCIFPQNATNSYSSFALIDAQNLLTSSICNLINPRLWATLKLFASTFSLTSLGKWQSSLKRKHHLGSHDLLVTAYQSPHVTHYLTECCYLEWPIGG